MEVVALDLHLIVDATYLQLQINKKEELNLTLTKLSIYGFTDARKKCEDSLT